MRRPVRLKKSDRKRQVSSAAAGEYADSLIAENKVHADDREFLIAGLEHAARRYYFGPTYEWIRDRVGRASYKEWAPQLAHAPDSRALLAKGLDHRHKDYAFHGFVFAMADVAEGVGIHPGTASTTGGKPRYSRFEQFANGWLTQVDPDRPQPKPRGYRSVLSNWKQRGNR